MEPIYVRQLKNPEFAKQVSAMLEKLNDVITNFPKTEADVTRLLEQHIKSHYGAYYVQQGWRFNHYVLSEIASKYPSLRAPAISVIRGSADTKHQWPREELYFVFTTFPEIEDQFIEIMRKEIQIQDFPQNELEQLGARFGSLRPDVVKRLVEYVNNPRQPFDITSLVSLVQKFPEVQAAAEARAKPIIQQGIPYMTVDQIELNFGRYVEFKKLVCGIVLENPKEIIQRSQGPTLQTWVNNNGLTRSEFTNEVLALLAEKGVTLATASIEKRDPIEVPPPGVGDPSENLGDQALAFAYAHWKGIALTIAGLVVLLYIRHQVKVFLRWWRERRSDKSATGG
jgi:hypothetical protein